MTRILPTFIITFTLLLNAAAAQSSTSESAKATSGSASIQSQLEKIAEDHKGVLGLYCRHLTTGEEYAINADELFETASTIKTVMMCAAFDLLDRNEAPFKSYYDKKEYTEDFKAGGSGLVQNYKPGTRLELKEIIHLMMTVSDNVATNMLGDWMGLEPVNAWLEKHNFKHTRVFSTIGGHTVVDAEGRKEWGLGRTTPREMSEVLVLIAEGKAASKAASEKMLRILGHQYFDSNIPAGVPPTTWAGTKSGSLNKSRSDTALISGPTGIYVLSIYTKENEDTSWNNTNEALQNIRKASNLLWNHFNPEHTYDIPEGIDKF